MKSNAQLAYEAYCSHRNWKSFDNKPLPQWRDVDQGIKAGWEAAAKPVMVRSVYDASCIWLAILGVLFAVALVISLFTSHYISALVAAAAVVACAFTSRDCKIKSNTYSED